MKDYSWRHNKIMFLENFYPREHTGTVATKLRNKRLLFLSLCPAMSAFPPTKTNTMVRKELSFV